jgi:hypothetical protein
MNILVTLLLVIVAIIAIFLIIALFSKKSYSLQREIIINKPTREVFDYIKHLKNQDNFNKWVMMDPNLKKTYRGTDGTVGFVYAWEGNKKAGKGEQEIINITEDRRLDVEVRFERPFAGISSTPFITESLQGNQTKLKWEMSSTMKYPMNIMLVFMNMDKMLGNDIQASLKTLKNILEKN